MEPRNDSTRTQAQPTEGFTLVELIVVIVIIGILAATALPRFVDLTGDARSAAVQGVGGALGSGVNLAHAAWLASGASTSTDAVTLEGSTTVGVNDSGWPENGSTGDGTVTATECVEVWTALLSNPPTAVTSGSGEYTATVSGTTCTYTLQAASGRSIAYNTGTGAVAITVP